MTQQERKIIRGEFCQVVGIGSPLFNAHRRTGDLPFEIRSVEEDLGTGRRWARFSVHEAASWLAAQDLARQGVTWSEAARVLRLLQRPEAVTYCSARPNDAIEHPGLFVSRVFVRREQGSVGRQLSHMKIYFGQMSEILQAISTREVSSVIATDLSYAYQLAGQRLRGVQDARRVATCKARRQWACDEDVAA